MLIVISIIPIIPITAPTTNNSITTNITPIENIKIECILTFPWIRNPKNKISNDNVAIIPAALIFLE